ncbi:hypothetical protein L21SP4_02323 [Kiritimatiella glycovorans]|uniref:Uncharacterized protein n=1 Tax=Kiritimatiella glycovorans TaxID=1307763 RepID=A0A0G3EN26_9BACT|nr:hypothetical protein L21SP4_02323 [Kiritimatiella glycovorans]
MSRRNRGDRGKSGGESWQRPSRASWQWGGEVVATALTGLVKVGGSRGNGPGASRKSGGMSFSRAKRCSEAEGRFPRGAQRRSHERSVVPRPKAVSTIPPRPKAVYSSEAFPRGAQRRSHERSVEDRGNRGNRGNGPDGPRGSREESRGNGPDGPRGNRGRSWQSGDVLFPRAQRCFEAEGRFPRGAQRRSHERSVVPRPKAVSPSAAFPRGAQRRFHVPHEARSAVSTFPLRGRRPFPRFPRTLCCFAVSSMLHPVL